MSRKNTSGWKTLSSKIVYKNSIIKLREDKVIRPDGKSGVYAFLSIPKTVGVVPLDKNNCIYLCKQYRYIFKSESWEIPRGFVEKTESPRQAAKRELLEEARLLSNNLRSIGSLRLSVGTVDEEAELFLARDLTQLSTSQDKEFEIQEVKRFTFGEVLLLLKDNKIVDGLTVGSILKVKQICTL